MAQGSVSRRMSWGAHDGGPPSFFWKCMKRKGFKSFVLKVCDSKGLAGANPVSADAKGLSEERRLELRCWKLDRETHNSPGLVSKGLTGSVEPSGMQSTHILALFDLS